MSQRNPWVFIPTLYFAEGLPYTIVMLMSTVYLKDMGAKNDLIGLTSLLAWPWTLKFVWAPLVDFFGLKKNWVVVAQVVLSILIGVLATTAVGPNPINAAIVVFSIAALASATHDVAIDAYYLEALPKDDQALFVGVRNTAYRLARIFGEGGMVVLAGALQAYVVGGHVLGKNYAWMSAFGILSFILLLMSAFHKFYLPVHHAHADARSIEEQNVAVLPKEELVTNGIASSRSSAGGADETPASSNVRHDSPNVKVGGGADARPSTISPEHPELSPGGEGFVGRYAYSIFSYFHQPGAIAIVCYILLFRLGDALMLKLASPFLLDPVAKGGMGLSVQEVGIVNGTVGVIFLLLGGIVGGWLISRGGVRRWLWPTAIFQNSAILLYWLLALLHPPISWVYVVNSVENFAYGLGCAAYTVFLLQTVKLEYKAAHYAVATGLMALGVMLPGAVSGYIQQQLGYCDFFLLSFFAAIPGIIAIFFLPIWKKVENGPATA